MSLAEIPLKHPVVVASVGGDRSFRRRIMEMGIVPGTTVRVLARAPLGDPLTVELRNIKLSLRIREAAEVQVREAATKSGEGV